MAAAVVPDDFLGPRTTLLAPRIDSNVFALTGITRGVAYLLEGNALANRDVSFVKDSAHPCVPSPDHSPHHQRPSGGCDGGPPLTATKGSRASAGLPGMTRPTPADVDRIAALRDPVLRNLQITKCYHELSAALAERIGPGANWCTVATWASKQAGQTIRKEDLVRALEAALTGEPGAQAAAVEIAAAASRIGAKPVGGALHASIWSSLLSAPADRAGDAVARGNRKVFEEIGRECARFTATVLDDSAPDPERTRRFCEALRPGEPPDGQRYLRQAFTRYDQARFETDERKRTELVLLANLEIGLHEQTRLQPEIAESLDAAVVDPAEFRKRLLEGIFPGGGWLARLRLFALRLLGRRSPFDEAVASLVAEARQQVRRMITAQLMTLTIPPGVRLRLGQDLAAGFPAALRELQDPDLCALLARIDPTPNSLRESGARDWADLPERLHFIVDLFRCYHDSAALFEEPFTPDQVAAMRTGKIPSGSL